MSRAGGGEVGHVAAAEEDPPASGRASPAIIRRIVLFPLPLVPSRTNSSPADLERDPVDDELGREALSDALEEDRHHSLPAAGPVVAEEKKKIEEGSEGEDGRDGVGRGDVARFELREDVEGCGLGPQSAGCPTPDGRAELPEGVREGRAARRRRGPPPQGRQHDPAEGLPAARADRVRRLLVGRLDLVEKRPDRAVQVGKGHEQVRQQDPHRREHRLPSEGMHPSSDQADRPPEQEQRSPDDHRRNRHREIDDDAEGPPPRKAELRQDVGRPGPEDGVDGRRRERDEEAEAEGELGLAAAERVDEGLGPAVEGEEDHRPEREQEQREEDGDQEADRHDRPAREGRHPAGDSRAGTHRSRSGRMSRAQSPSTTRLVARSHPADFFDEELAAPGRARGGRGADRPKAASGEDLLRRVAPGNRRNASTAFRLERVRRRLRSSRTTVDSARIVRGGWTISPASRPRARS